jgi:hypothetical protein
MLHQDQMNPEDFERRLQRQPLRQVPNEWRIEILASARAASATRRTAGGEYQNSSLRMPDTKLSDVLWPHPLAWAVLAAVWVIILGVNARTWGGPQTIARRGTPIPSDVLVAHQEQDRLLSELLGPREIPIAAPPKPSLPKPRSERRWEMRMG